MLLKIKPKEYGKKLKEIKENINYSQQLSETGSWTFDINKNEIYFTEQANKILGINADEFSGDIEYLYSSVHPDDQDRLRSFLPSAL